MKDGRYTWRYDRVLPTSCVGRDLGNTKKPGKKSEGLKLVDFVKEGEKGQKAGVEERRLLGTLTDWQMRVDLRQGMEFQPEIAVTNKRPDTVIWSASGRRVTD